MLCLKVTLSQASILNQWLLTKKKTLKSKIVKDILRFKKL